MQKMIQALVDFFTRISFTVKMLYLYLILLPVSSNILPLIKGVGKFQLSDLIFLPMFISWMLDRKTIVSLLKDKRNKILIFIIAGFLIATLSSILNSINLLHSVVDWVGITYLAVLFMIIVSVIDTRETFIGLLAAYAIGAVIAALAGLGALFCYSITGNVIANPLLMFVKFQSSFLFLPRIQSFFHTPNMYLSFEHVGLIALLPLLFLMEKRLSLLAKSAIWISIFIVVISVFLTGSQTMAGFVVTLFIVSFLFTGKIVSAMRYILFLATMTILLFAACATIWMICPATVNLDTQAKDVNIRVNYAYSYHIIPTMYALSMFKKHPVIGVGIGTFADQYPSYINMDIEKITAAKQGVSPGAGVDPHNTYSGSLAEWGILGFMAMLLIIIYMLRILTSTPVNAKVDFAFDSIRKVLLAGFIGFLLNAFFMDSMMLRHFWIFMAVIVIFDKIRTQEQ